MKIVYGLISCFSFSLVAQNNYYVAQSGSNPNHGSLSSPWQSIQYGINQLQPGDTLNVRQGTCTENISFPNSGTLDT
jgi:hypothetical protein